MYALHIAEHGRKRHRLTNKVSLFHKRNYQEFDPYLTQFPHECQLALGAKSVRRRRNKKGSMRGWCSHNRRAWILWQWRWSREHQNGVRESSTSFIVVHNHMLRFTRVVVEFYCVLYDCGPYMHCTSSLAASTTAAYELCYPPCTLCLRMASSQGITHVQSQWGSFREGCLFFRFRQPMCRGWSISAAWSFFRPLHLTLFGGWPVPIVGMKEDRRFQRVQTNVCRQMIQPTMIIGHLCHVYATRF